MTSKYVDELKGKSYLFWDIKDPSVLSEDSILERVINYGEWEDFLLVLNSLGIKRASEIFFQSLEKKRVNYSPKAINYFTLFFNKHVR